MYIANVTNYYENITSSKYINYDNMILTNYTNNENNIEKMIPLFTIIPCGISLMCLLSLMVYTLIKPLFNKKKIMSNYRIYFLLERRKY